MTETNPEDRTDTLFEIDALEAWTPGDILYFGPSSRSIALFGEITKEATLPIISQILELETRSPGKPIQIYINSDGGSLADGLCIYDALRMITSPIVSFAMGACSSAGLLVLAAGDKRLCCKNTLFYYHQAIFPSDIFMSKPQINSVNEAYGVYQEKYDSILIERTKIKKSLWNKHFRGNTSKYFTAEEALTFNLVDQIIKPKKRKQIKTI